MIEDQSHTIIIPGINLLLKLGTEGDCFGYLYDLGAEECKKCGDIELCAMKFSQVQHKTRGQIESKQEFKDIQEPKLLEEYDKKEVIKFIKRRIKKGKSKSISIIKAAKKFNINKKQIKEWI